MSSLFLNATQIAIALQPAVTDNRKFIQQLAWGGCHHPLLATATMNPDSETTACEVGKTLQLILCRAYADLPATAQPVPPDDIRMYAFHWKNKNDGKIHNGIAIGTTDPGYDRRLQNFPRHQMTQAIEAIRREIFGDSKDLPGAWEYVPVGDAQGLLAAYQRTFPATPRGQDLANIARAVANVQNQRFNIGPGSDKLVIIPTPDMDALRRAEIPTHSPQRP